jgi:hypothetical protein
MTAFQCTDSSPMAVSRVTCPGESKRPPDGTGRPWTDLLLRVLQRVRYLFWSFFEDEPHAPRRIRSVFGLLQKVLRRREGKTHRSRLPTAVAVIFTTRTVNARHTKTIVRRARSGLRRHKRRPAIRRLGRLVLVAGRAGDPDIGAQPS